MEQESEGSIDFHKMEEWEMKPWKRLGLTVEQWTKPMSELSAEHRKVIFDVYNVQYNLTLKPQDFGFKSK
jgi:hypothetical protein